MYYPLRYETVSTRIFDLDLFLPPNLYDASESFPAIYRGACLLDVAEEKESWSYAMRNGGRPQQKTLDLPSNKATDTSREEGLCTSTSSCETMSEKSIWYSLFSSHFPFDKPERSEVIGKSTSILLPWNVPACKRRLGSNLSLSPQTFLLVSFDNISIPIGVRPCFFMNQANVGLTRQTRAGRLGKSSQECFERNS